MFNSVAHLDATFWMHEDSSSDKNFTGDEKQNPPNLAAGRRQGVNSKFEYSRISDSYKYVVTEEFPSAWKAHFLSEKRKKIAPDSKPNQFLHLEA